MLVVHRRGRAGKVVDPVRLHVEREGHIVSDELKARVGQQVADVVFGAREEVVEADHLVPVGQEPPAQVRTNEARATGDKCPEG